MNELTRDQLCGRLRVDAKELRAWLRGGLPSTGRGRNRRFDPAAVRDWLLAKGKAEPIISDRPTVLPADQPIAHTCGQVADYFGVSLRTVTEWVRQGMPGKPGRRGTQEGWFPLFDIDAWVEGRRQADGVDGDDEKTAAQARLASARAELVKWELSDQRGRLIDVADVEFHWTRFLNEAETLLTKMPAQIARSLPDGIDAKTRRRARTMTQRSVDLALGILALLVEPDVELAGQGARGAGKSAVRQRTQKRLDGPRRRGILASSKP